MPEIIGELPKPRLLVLNAADSIVTAIERLAPTTRFITTEELSVIRQRDWDGAIAFGNAISLESHLFVIQFGGTWGGVMPSDAATGRDNYQLKIVPSSNTVQFRVPDSLPTTVRPLIQSLTRLVTSKSMNSVMWAGMHGYANECRPTIETPFIEDDDDYVLAGWFSRPSGAKWWWLPANIEHPERWIAAALEDWSDIAPDTFPGRPLWQKRDEWSTPAELEVRAKAQELQEDIDRFIRDMDQKKLELATKEEAEFVRANRHERGLLTAQGDDLVDAVRACLEEIGFHVVNVDQEIATKGDRREDLRISDHDRPDWVAIAEVRGYKRGAQLNDLLRISRFVARYVQEAGRMPDASWYIVNHNMDQDPSIRPTPLASNPTEVTTFVDGNGLIIDTRFLFKKLMEVRSGLIESRDLRLALISGTGVIDV